MTGKMRISIDFTKSAQENANDYYQKAKRFERKRVGAEKAIAELEERYRKVEKERSVEERRVIKRTEKRWFQKFHWFYTSKGMLVIGGRDAGQNELINSKHFGDNDLFFHADIYGASVVILVEGVNGDEESRIEAAQFSGCYSSAWAAMLRSIDVYSLKRSQISKAKDKGSLGKGSFLMSGEREWYRNIKLELAAFVKDGEINFMPSVCFDKLEIHGRHVLIVQGDMKKSDAAKKISKFLEFDDLDTIMQQLPSGTFSIKIFD